MMDNLGRDLMSSRIFDSKIKSTDITKSERILGYFVAPAIILTMGAISGQGYLNVFYTDVLNLTPIAGGMFLVMLPIISRILNVFTNIIMGRIIDRTKSKQGKARPWLLLAGPLLLFSGILLFTVPRADTIIQIIWVLLSYNFYFCVASTMYSMSHTLLVPLSTRNSKQRDKLAMIQSMGNSIVPGTVGSVLIPLLLLPMMGIDQGKWITVMAIISILALPAVILEYYFTRERITEEAHDSSPEKNIHTFHEQMNACFSNRYWVIIILIIIVFQFYNNFQITSLLYYSNWVLGTYNDGVTLALLNAVGQAPLGLGIFLLMPIVKKYGKRNTMFVGSIIAIPGCILCAVFPHNMGLVLFGLVIRSFGTLPMAYTLIGMLADCLDHVEWLKGFRSDGFSVSVYSICLTMTAGISAGVFNLFLGITGYVAPLTDGNWVSQNQSVQNLFISGVFIVPAISLFIIVFLLSFFNIEKELPQIQKDIIARHKTDVEAQGESYINPDGKMETKQEGYKKE
jgi:GPH family glycoside/pentoside/hexuronide:cation symporter